MDYVCVKRGIKHFIESYDFFEKLVCFAIENAINYGENTVIEYIFKIEDVKRLQDKYNISAYALYTDTNEENLRKILKEYSKPYDWPFYVAEDDFNRNIKEILELNTKLKEECQKVGVKLIDTSYGEKRDLIINELCQKIGMN